MLQQDQPDDCESPVAFSVRLSLMHFETSYLTVVLATNETHEIKEYVNKAFDVVGIKLRWEGEGVDEVAIDVKTEKVLVRIDEK
jgi:GDP-D-mannose dehydratase